MSDNTKLIDEARERAHQYTGGPEADRLWRLADALEAAQAPISIDVWPQMIFDERDRQVAKGYDDQHDDAHGADHLLVWAIEFLRRGERTKAAAILHSVRGVLSRAR